MRIKLYLLFFLVNSLVGQDFNASFLESLPDNVRQDLEKNIEQDDNKEKNYPSPDTRIKNLESALKEAEDTLNKIKYNLDSKDESNSDEIAIFGEEFFSSFQSTFLPINDPNMSADYVLDSGDMLKLQLFGQKEITSELVINRDGVINAPEVGPIVISGLTLEAARNLITRKYSDAFIDIEVFISLNEIRDINVLLIGKSNNPGMYTLPGGSTFLSLLSAAGGISREGSYRYITHKRGGKVIQELDLYDTLIKGNISTLSQLRSGDVLLVNPKLNQIRLSGFNLKPHFYELLENENIEDLLSFAGVRKSQIRGFIGLDRIEGNSFKSLKLDPKNLSNVSLIHGDSVKIFGSDPSLGSVKKVKILGEVLIPGDYSVTDQAKLSDLIKMAGGFKENAYFDAGVFIRKSTKATEMKIRDKSIQELIRFLIASPSMQASGSNVFGGGNSTEGIISLIALLENFEPSGRIVTEFNLSKLEASPNLDITLQDGDFIFIPHFSPEVHVLGELMNPGSLRYSTSFEAQDYINLAGGFSQVADDQRVILVDPDGTTQIYTKNFLFFNKDLYISPGSVIYVPREMGKVDGINLASTLAPIVSSLALSLASLNSIN